MLDSGSSEERREQVNVRLSGNREHVMCLAAQHRFSSGFVVLGLYQELSSGASGWGQAYGNCCNNMAFGKRDTLHRVDPSPHAFFLLERL